MATHRERGAGPGAGTDPLAAGTQPTSPPAAAGSLEASAPAAVFAAWRSRPGYHHLLVCGLLVLIAALRYGPDLSSPTPLVDEGSYLAAFRNLAAGRSPYAETGFYYPAAFAYAGAFLLQHLGVAGTLALLRTLNLLGLVAAAWIALAWVPLRWPARVALGGAWLVLSPAVDYGLGFGNLSFLVTGLTLIALLTWPRRPLAAGAALGLGIAVKPVAPAALLTLGAHRAGRGGRRHRIAAAVALGLGALLFLAFPYRDGLLAIEIGRLTMTRIFSLYRILHTLGLDVPPVLPTAVVAAGAVWLARRRPLLPVQHLCLATAASVLAVPVLWSHTLVLVLPLQTLALVTAWRRRRQAGPAPGIARTYEPAFVTLAVLTLQLAQGGGVDDLPALVQLPLLAVLYLAPAFLLAYQLRAGDSF